MSALSELCDKLRGWAEQMRKIQDPVLSTIVAKDVERAADIIWNLRNLLNDAYNKNDKLSELQMDTWHLLQEVHGKHSTDMGAASADVSLEWRWTGDSRNDAQVRRVRATQGRTLRD